VDRFSKPAAVALISAATLSYEILLVRVFAIEQFHHFAFMAIGVAMLGFGVGGVALALARPGPVRAARGFEIGFADAGCAHRMYSGGSPHPSGCDAAGMEP